MKTKILWTVLSCLMVTALVLASCGPAAEEGEEKVVNGKVTEKAAPVVKEKEEVEEAVVAKPTGPQYGGRISLCLTAEPDTHDPWYGAGGAKVVGRVLEKLGIPDWALDREVFAFQSVYIPLSVVKPHLAESYETPDPLTIIFHIRKGVHWHNKPPMNGREMNAYDVEFSFHRILGLGSGFTEPSPYTVRITALPIESVTATDKWTVVVKMSEPNLEALGVFYYESFEADWIVPPEVIEQHGDLRDWKNLVGTGPYELTDWVGGSSMSFTKNPDYWCYDDKYPENRLPYADEIKVLFIPDLSTRLAALRTGKLARLEDIGLEQVESLQRTNPELLFSRISTLGEGIAMKVTEPPFNDKRVRQAMQKAIDNEYITRTYYEGLADPTPYGIIGPAILGYYIPFEEWPEEIKEGFRYDPERAKELLAEAGYPKGFKTAYEVIPGSYGDADLAQILKAYWTEIGVDVTIKVMERGAFIAHWINKGYEGMTHSPRGIDDSPVRVLTFMAYSGNMWNKPGMSDPEYDALVDKASAATTLEEQMRYCREADMLWVKQQVNISLPRIGSFTFWQPWLKGYSGEMVWGGGGLYDAMFARCWVDQELKKSMGQ